MLDCLTPGQIGTVVRSRPEQPGFLVPIDVVETLILDLLRSEFSAYDLEKILCHERCRVAEGQSTGSGVSCGAGPLLGAGSHCGPERAQHDEEMTGNDPWGEIHQGSLRLQ